MADRNTDTPARLTPEDVARVEYRPVPAASDYRVGDDGSVWKRRGGADGGWRRVKLTRSHRDRPYWHLVVTLYLGGGRCVQRKVHRVVLEAFVGPCPHGMQCCHNDGDVTNNRLSNLRWDTAKANANDRDLHGTHPRGDECQHRKLNSVNVETILAMCARGIPKTRIADEFRVSERLVRAIVAGECWVTVTRPAAAREVP